MAKTEKRPLKGMGAETFFGGTGEGTATKETVEPSHSETTSQQNSEELAVKTSFYPSQDQLDKLDDLVTEYNRRYRRQRKKINRNDVIRYLIDQCSPETLDQLTL